MSILKYLNEELAHTNIVEESQLYENKYKNKIAYHKSLVELFGESLNEDDEVTDGDEDEFIDKNGEERTNLDAKKYETNNDTENVISLLKSDEDFRTDPKSFAKSVAKNKYPEMLTTYDLEDLGKMKLFKLPNYDIGYALKDFTDPNGKVHPFGEVVSVHNSEHDRGVHGIGKLLMQHAIKNGAMALDHFDTNKLTPLYSKMGFKEYARDEYDPQYDPNGTFKKAFGEVPVIYRMR